MLAYLHRLLANNLIDVVRKLARDDFAQSLLLLADWLAAGQTLPSEQAMRYE